MSVKLLKVAVFQSQFSPLSDFDSLLRSGGFLINYLTLGTVVFDSEYHIHDYVLRVRVQGKTEV